MNDYKSFKTPCPKCGGVVRYWELDADCRGNPGGAGIDCQACGKEFSREEWSKISKEKIQGESLTPQSTS
jgi:endogenous inhibitor of DNA gyrase (YacG/DUF329 family)